MRQDFFQFSPTSSFLQRTTNPGKDRPSIARVRLSHHPAPRVRAGQGAARKAAASARHPGLAVAGCLAWQREGLGEPEAVRDATEAYRVENDSLGAFLVEPTHPRLRADGSGQCSVSSLQAWATERAARREALK